MFDNILDFFGVESKSKSHQKSVICLIGGVVLGAAAGILLAPQSGAETRDQIKDAATEGMEKGKEISKKATQEIKDKVEELKTKAQKTGEILEENAEDIVEELEEEEVIED